MVLKNSDVVFMYPADQETYKAYQATWVAWGGASKKAVEDAQALGIHYAASMWLLTAGAENLHKHADLRNAVSKDILLEPIAVPWLWDHTYEGTPSYFGCTNNPVFREHSRQNVIRAMETGADGLHIDDHLGSAGSFWSGGCFCDHCMEGFRKFIKAPQYSERIGLLGIDVDKFNYREYLRGIVHTRDEYLKRRNELPLIDIFQTFQVKSASAFVMELRKLAEQVSGKQITCSANTGIPNPAHMVVIPNLTHCVCEVEFRHGNKNAPEASAISAFKVADAIGKPVAATASGWDWAYAHAHDNAVGLVRLWIAESYALGHRLMVPHRKWAFTTEKGTHWYQSKPEDFAYIYHFIRAKSHLLDHYEPYANIALVFCNRSIRRHGLENFIRICKALADRNFCFSVIIAGDDWIDDQITRADLNKFALIIVPEPCDLDESQIKALDTHHDVRYMSSADMVELIEPDLSPISVSNANNVWVLPRVRQSGPLVCHVLNRNYDEDLGRVKEIEDVTITLRSPLIHAENVKSCKLFSPGGEDMDISFKLTGSDLKIDIPKIGLWSLMVLETNV